MIFPKYYTAHEESEILRLQLLPTFKQQFLSSHFPFHPQSRSAGGLQGGSSLQVPSQLQGRAQRHANSAERPSGLAVGPSQEHWLLERANHISCTPEQTLLPLCLRHANHSRTAIVGAVSRSTCGLKHKPAVLSFC